MKRYKRKLKDERGQGMGIGGERQMDGGVDYCICPNCGLKIKHERGIPCTEVNCPDCNTLMTGE